MYNMDSKKSNMHVLFRNSSPSTPSTMIALLCRIYIPAFSSTSYFSNLIPYNTTKLLKKAEKHSEQGANKALSTMPTSLSFTNSVHTHLETSTVHCQDCRPLLVPCLKFRQCLYSCSCCCWLILLFCSFNKHLLLIFFPQSLLFPYPFPLKFLGSEVTLTSV